MNRLNLARLTSNHNAISKKTYLKCFSSFESRKRIVFLGSPEPAAKSLKILHNNLSEIADIVAVVTQPPAPAKRGRKLLPSPVHIIASNLSIPVMHPKSAKDSDFLTNLDALDIDLCITVAYGNFLPKKFLDIPKFGTINIHPSLLPLYRGAAPVQRCIQHGDKTTGVSLLFTELKMDSGPIIYQEKLDLSGNEKSTELLDRLFDKGSKALCSILPKVFSKNISLMTQDESKATYANKINVSESLFFFHELTAEEIHNKCRAFAGWPEIHTFFKIVRPDGRSEFRKVKIITTEILKECPRDEDGATGDGPIKRQKVGDHYLLIVHCKDGTRLGIAELQPEFKKVMNVRDFLNGIQKPFQLFASEAEPTLS